MRTSTWPVYRDCHDLYNLKNVKNTHGGVFLLVKLKPATILKVNSNIHVFNIVQVLLNCAELARYDDDKSYLL